jgi:hypothetical protein
MAGRRSAVTPLAEVFAPPAEIRTAIAPAQIEYRFNSLGEVLEQYVLPEITAQDRRLRARGLDPFGSTVFMARRR